MKRIFLGVLKIVLALYIILCGCLYFFQEKVIYQPQKLDKNHQFIFEQKFEEIDIPSTDETKLNGLLFKADSSKGVIFYLHGSAGSLIAVGNSARTYTDLNFDLFAFNYRGYGKSEGEITSQEQLFQDNQMVYNELKKKYSEDKIIVLGFSMGTGLASKLSSANNPKLLILQAPYYNSTDLRNKRFISSLFPSFLWRYNFETSEYLKSCKMPVVVFHGNEDEAIYYGSSIKLKEEFKKHDTLITLKGQGHTGISDNEDYKLALKNILNK